MQNDFSSLDKLVEFGLGVGVATQMMNTMNKVIAQTAVPGVGINPGVTAANNPMTKNEKSYYVLVNENIAGPFTDSEMTVLIIKGILNKDTFVWETSSPSWNKAESIPEVNKLILLNQ